MENFEGLYADLKAKFNSALIEFLQPLEKTVNENLYGAIKYSIVNSGKRIRPLLCMLGARFAGGDEDGVMPFALALEMIHTYSLVHDDLPAVDNDSMRRGKLTTHVMHGEAMAVFAGDALLNLACEIMTENVVKTADFKRLRAMNLIMRASGARGLLNGQAKDVDYENCADYFLEHIISMYRNKTADLIRASLVSGALICGAERGELENLSSFADSLGIFFQLQDDLMDEGGEKIDLNMSVDDYLAMDDSLAAEENGGAEPVSRTLNSEGFSEKPGSIFDIADGTDNAGGDGVFHNLKYGVADSGNNGIADNANDKGIVNNASDAGGKGVFNNLNYGVTDNISSDGVYNDSGKMGEADGFSLLSSVIRESDGNAREERSRSDAKIILGLNKTADEIIAESIAEVDGKTLLRLGKEKNASELFKPANKEKITFLKAAGEDETLKLLDEYEDYIRAAIAPYAERADELIGLFEFIKKRTE
ncbi:MAG: polyprenyl synthetase family protein [Clostridiales bacterium]|jgi:geranylgeranyl diphosphate synthase type II|nr:polyprenyl synthetase family protein [Clostridiales bacterium]